MGAQAWGQTALEGPGPRRHSWLCLQMFTGVTVITDGAACFWGTGRGHCSSLMKKRFRVTTWPAEGASPLGSVAGTWSHPLVANATWLQEQDPHSWLEPLSH